MTKELLVQLCQELLYLFTNAKTTCNDIAQKSERKAQIFSILPFHVDRCKISPVAEEDQLKGVKKYQKVEMHSQKFIAL